MAAIREFLHTVQHNPTTTGRSLSLSICRRLSRINKLGNYQVLPQCSQVLSDPCWSLRPINNHLPDHARSKRQPITPEVLRKLHTVWSQGPMTFDVVMLWAACCLGFFGFMRAGEFTCPTLQPLPDHMLSLADVSIDRRENPQMLVVLLRHSKTDPFSAGIQLYMGRTGEVGGSHAGLSCHTSPQPRAAICV